MGVLSIENCKIWKGYTDLMAMKQWRKVMAIKPLDFGASYCWTKPFPWPMCVWFSWWANVHTPKLMREAEFYKSPVHFPTGPILGRNSIMFLAAGWETSTWDHQTKDSEVCETKLLGQRIQSRTTVTPLYPVCLVGTVCALLFPTRSGTLFDRTCTAFPHVFPTAPSLSPALVYRS